MPQQKRKSARPPGPRVPIAERRSAAVSSALMEENILVDVHVHKVDRHRFIIYLHSEARDYGNEDEMAGEPGVEYTMASRFCANLNILSGIDPTRPILMMMNTNGGDWEQGMMIYEAIRLCPNPVTILNLSSACSMSSIIFQAADKRAMTPYSKFMFHFGEGSAHAHSPGQLTTQYEEVLKMHSIMLDIYARRMKRGGRFKSWSLRRIETKLEAEMRNTTEVWLDAKKTVQWGFADTIFRGNWSRLRATEKLSDIVLR